MDYYTAGRKKELLPFTTAWMESIMLNEISQVVKDKYHMISPISGTYSTKQTSKQNITRDIEIKNKLTVTRGEEGGGERGKEVEGSSRNMYKGPLDKPKGNRIEGGRWESGARAEWWWWGGWRQLYLNTIKFFLIYIMIYTMIPIL